MSEDKDIVERLESSAASRELQVIAAEEIKRLRLDLLDISGNCQKIKAQAIQHRAEIEMLLNVFRHAYQNNPYKVGYSCRQCGLDYKHVIHAQSGGTLGARYTVALTDEAADEIERLRTEKRAWRAAYKGLLGALKDLVDKREVNDD